MDSVFSWAILCVIGFVFLIKFLSALPDEPKKDIYTSTEMKFIIGGK